MPWPYVDSGLCLSRVWKGLQSKTGSLSTIYVIMFLVVLNRSVCAVCEICSMRPHGLANSKATLHNQPVMSKPGKPTCKEWSLRMHFETPLRYYQARPDPWDRP